MSQGQVKVLVVLQTRHGKTVSLKETFSYFEMETRMVMA
jgi:hypothetical protein